MRPCMWMPLAVCALPLTALAAQQQVRVEPGVRVRVTAPQLRSGRQVGLVARVASDTLVVGLTPVPLQSITRLEVSTGRKSHWLLGMAMGSLAGAGVGAIVMASSGDLDRCDPFSPAECVLVGAGMGAAVGIPLGAIVGAIARTDRWQDVPFDRTRVGGMRQRDAPFNLTVSVSF